MSQSDQSEMRIGCPECEATVNASVPPGPGIHDERTTNRLQGRETTCRNCGHEVELYYY
ncbi:hypothetical protein [Haloterrigena salinisoli]|uniref:hypothetical protein n=1 Tax=Haloterrigena salinisoli TaxID=3132747 RepID=UPI0030D51A56